MNKYQHINITTFLLKYIKKKTLFSFVVLLFLSFTGLSLLLVGSIGVFERESVPAAESGESGQGEGDRGRQ